MECYKLTSMEEEPVIVECSQEQEESILREADHWYVKYYMIWSCCARSDNGIDDRRIENEKRVPIKPEMMVMNETGEIIGCYVENHLFVFTDSKTHSYCIEEDLGYEGGWGDITETHCYHLKNLKAE